MSTIEPNWLSLVWFAGLATVCGVAFLIVAGKFPLDARPDAARSLPATLLIIGNVVLLAMLLAGTVLYGYAELRWSTLVVVSGLIFLFTPALFEEWRWPLRNTTIELSVLVGIQILALAVLAKVGGSAFAILS
ncbi:MAG: hypothetical protein EKK35_17225 [Bradyrhizobiaceae bacterium]|uniref:Uncharacterized protein n=1 Tax=Afipia broomeae ATCC 49717 TaxID=883078 RepID=K8PLN3_9BRAD|nr:hypothetical protein [Afipia broomeae]EKS41689.1 hypothetical protein HMPREF9695_00781 [Afipia broomeae ATCC 49717]RTL77436.1 MAG: hypothetical protein EKK35_17225 [Bradyrhizobiaceae bacterium]